MSSRIERNASVIWVIGSSLCAGDKSGVTHNLKVALTNLKQWVLPDGQIAMDRPYARAINQTLVNVKSWIGTDTQMDEEVYLAYAHMLNAIVSDFYLQVPRKPAKRRYAWLMYNNAVVELINELTSDDTDDRGVIKGCQWAVIIQSILEK